MMASTGSPRALSIARGREAGIYRTDRQRSVMVSRPSATKLRGTCIAAQQSASVFAAAQQNTEGPNGLLTCFWPLRPRLPVHEPALSRGGNRRRGMPSGKDIP